MRRQHYCDSICAAISSVVGPGTHQLHEPKLDEADEASILLALRSKFVSTAGPDVDSFELELSSYLGGTDVTAFNSGTSALHMVLLLAGVGPGDEVIVPAISFVATANAVSYVGAYPHFVDIENQSFGICPDKLIEHLRMIGGLKNGQLVNAANGRRIAAIIPVHVFGLPCKIGKLAEIAHMYEVPLIEDASESLGSFFRDQPTGTIGDFGVFSFNGNKTITTGAGGALITSTSENAERAKFLSTTAKIPHEWEYVHSEVGFNTRMPSLNAALGRSQLTKIDMMVRLKRILHDHYKKAFDSVGGATLVTESLGTYSNYWLQSIVLDHALVNYRNEIIAKLRNKGIAARPVWKILTQLPMYEHCMAGDLSCALDLQSRIINPPSSAFLGERWAVDAEKGAS